jgi:hypothetical protein
MIIRTNTSAEADAVLARAGEFKILRMARGDTNSSWIFTVCMAEQRPLPLDVPQFESRGDL